MSQQATTTTLRGACDASGGIALGGGCIAVANVNRTACSITTSHGQGKCRRRGPLQVADDPENPECDLESAAELDGLIYWIGSHSQSKSGKTRRNRHRLFATRRVGAEAAVRLEFAGGLYKKPPPRSAH